MLNLTGENPDPDSLKSPDYLTTLSTGADLLLDFAKKQQNPLLAIAVELYESDSKKKMWDKCNALMHKIEMEMYFHGTTYFTKCSSHGLLLSVCILYMICRASKFAKQAILAKDDISFVSAKNGTKLIKAPELKVIQFLFNVARLSTMDNPFEMIAQVTNKHYNKSMHGTNLMRFVETCLCKTYLTDVVFNFHLHDMELKVPLKDRMVNRFSEMDVARGNLDGNYIPYREDGKYY